MGAAPITPMIRTLGWTAVFTVFVCALSAQPGPDTLALGFKTPPDSAKPRTWWHWTASDVTEAGITKDLEWMKRVGLGGFMLADVNVGGGQTVEPKTPYGTPEWYQAVKYAATEADRLGLEMAIFSSPGWSETGGPWVKPNEAMKKLVWSELRIEGGKTFSSELPQPPTANGQIRNTRVGYYNSGHEDPTFYADAAVVAYRTPNDDVDASAAKPKVSTHAGPVDGAALLDDDLTTVLTVPAPKDGSPAWVQFEFAEPFSACAITLGGKGGSANGIPVGRVLASDDGANFRTLVTLPGAQLYRQGMVRTFTFSPTKAKFYRIEMTAAPLGPALTMNQEPSKPAEQYVLSEALLHGGARVNRWEEKAGFSFLFEYEHTATPETPRESEVAGAGVVDLRSKMKSDGTLVWDAPAGNWTVLRLGYSLTGAKNRPATSAGSGFEADKLSREHMTAYYHGYFDPLEKALGPLFGKSLRYVMMDSWEAGTNNWTDNVLAEFKKRRGYEATRYLPALTGRVVDSADVSDRFLWDFRRTLADLWAENHYGTMAELLRQHQIGIYAEAAGVSLEMPEDTLLNKSKVEIPMGEFWVRDLHPRLMYLQDVRGAASAAHVYGKKIVAAESFTGGGYESPSTLKNVADYWFAQGVNRIVFHTSAHQPLDTKPGNTMVGTHLNRNITWAEEAGPFVTYLARTSFMLQQGTPVADLVYLLDEGAPSTPPIWEPGTRPTPPEGYDYDFINADALLTRMAVSEDGRLTLPDGPSYRALVLPETDRMRPELLRKIRELVVGGALLIGPRPTRSPSLTNAPHADDEVRALAMEIWGDLDGASRTIRQVGKGLVCWGWPLEKILARQKIPKDFEYARGLDADVAWTHRRAGDADIYFVTNLTPRPQTFDARFRVAGRRAELWRPDTGAMDPTGYSIEEDRTTVPLRLAEHEAVFVVFRRAAKTPSWQTTAETETTLATLDGPWTIRFPEKLGAPESVELPTLGSWIAQSDPGVRYFSGTATYRKTFQAPKTWFDPNTMVLLDLGRVGDLAEVALNGKKLGLVWKAPYRVDVSGPLIPGENQLEVKVTNEWTNRIAGDRMQPDEKKVLAPEASQPRRVGNLPTDDGSLPDSGLLGPVRLIASTATHVADAPDDTVANIPVNYTEAKVGTDTLPDPLKLANGQAIRDARTWMEQRRPELLKLYEENQYGKAPGKPAEMSVEVFEPSAPAFDGKAVRRQLTIYFTKDKVGPKLDLLVYLPAQRSGPTPVLLNISFTPNNLTVEDPGVKVGAVWNAQQKQRVPAPTGRRFGALDPRQILERGYAFATFNYTDVEPDAPGSAAFGIRGVYQKPGQTERAPDEWGTIAAWAWGISRVVDYLETDHDIDAKRIGIFGISRLGKTVLWAGAQDPRISLVIASCSGEGGAALSRRNYGETIAHLASPTRYEYQFAAKYGYWGTRVSEFPIDGHLLVSLIAPRPVLLQTGDTDNWSDPKGEFMSTLAARPVFELLGQKGPDTDLMPPAGVRVGHTLGYFMHAGGHGALPSDLPVFLDFLDEHWKTSNERRSL